MTASRAVLVTGSSSGIGRATAQRLARAGWKVWASARHPEALADLEADGCRPLALDVTDETSMVEAVAAIEREDGAVGVLVNNAGYSQAGAIEAVPIDLARRQFETNVFGAARLTQLVLPGMRAQGWGRIVNVSSMGGVLTFPGAGWYYATKHALEALSDALRFEVAAFGIDVVIVQPGLIRTAFSDAAVRTLARTTGGARGVYTDFDEAVAASTRSVYQSGALSRLAGGPDAVATVIEKALAAKRPRTRYPVTASARVLLALHAVLPDRLWDGVMRGTFPQPGRG